MGVDLYRMIDCENRARCASSTRQTLIRDLNQRNLLPRRRWNIPLAEILRMLYDLVHSDRIYILYAIYNNLMTVHYQIYNIKLYLF